MRLHQHRPVHENLVLIAYFYKLLIKTLADVSSVAKSLKFGLSLHLTPFCVYEQLWPSLLNNAMSTKISRAFSYVLLYGFTNYTYMHTKHLCIVLPDLANTCIIQLFSHCIAIGMQCPGLL